MLRCCHSALRLAIKNRFLRLSSASALQGLQAHIEQAAVMEGMKEIVLALVDIFFVLQDWIFDWVITCLFAQ